MLCSHQQVQKTKFTPSTVSIAFNLALLHEKQGHYEAASEIYKVLLLTAARLCCACSSASTCRVLCATAVY
jgi:hypothetical protein